MTPRVAPGSITSLNAAPEGRYRIERQLVEGGMATVYLADDLRHERKVFSTAIGAEDRVGIPAEEYLVVEVAFHRDPSAVNGAAVDHDPAVERPAATQEALIGRLEAEPGVGSVALADQLPRKKPQRRPQTRGTESHWAAHPLLPGRTLARDRRRSRSTEPG